MSGATSHDKQDERDLCNSSYPFISSVGVCSRKKHYLDEHVQQKKILVFVFLKFGPL
jgi:hypothetical protein